MSRAFATKRVTSCDVTGKRVLLVGAGGIGCELVKNLVLMGFDDLEMIDLDTIDYSNLNRQFLFRKEHVDKSKAEVAREVVLNFPHDPKLQITAYKGNIKEGIHDAEGNKTVDFDIKFFKSFDIVLNGLDNVDARRHVNRCCLAANVPLIESGTQGYLGQVRVILKGTSQCYECNPPPAKKEYPVCTVRNHPDKPVHVIHWAKTLLFERVFGGKETDLIDTAEGAPAADGNAEGASAEEASATADAAAGASSASAPPSAAPAPLAREEGEAASAYAARIFHAVYEADIERLLRMDELWKTRKPPTPIRLSELTLVDAAALSEDDQSTWSVSENASVFVHAITTILETRPHDVGHLEFDKDDETALDFVTAASNLRAAVFGIPIQPKWEVKSIAGNIIPAIATTNAIIAGFIVLEALKVRASPPEICQYLPSLAHALRSYPMHRPRRPQGARWQGRPVPLLHVQPRPRRAEEGHAHSGFQGEAYLAIAPHLHGLLSLAISMRGVLLGGSKLDDPSPRCSVCGTAEQTLTLDTRAWTVGQLIDLVAKKHLSFNRPTIDGTPFGGEPDQLCEGEELDADEDADEIAKYARYRSLTLAGLPRPIGDGAELKITDTSQGELTISVRVRHAVLTDKDKNVDPALFELTAATEPTAGSKRPLDDDASAKPGKRPATAADDDDVTIVECG